MPVKKKKKKYIFLWCYLRPHHSGQYKAVCLSLNIFVFGKTPGVAHENLHGAMIDYLEWAQKNKVPLHKVKRPAPVSFYFDFYYTCLRAIIEHYKNRFKTFSERANTSDLKLQAHVG